MCDVLIAALSQMLKDREDPSSSHASCNGPVPREEAASEAPGEASGGEGEEGRAERCVLPEDRQRAIELLREGEASVLRCCLAWVEVSKGTYGDRHGPPAGKVFAFSFLVMLRVFIHLKFRISFLWLRLFTRLPTLRFSDVLVVSKAHTLLRCWL